MSLTLNAKERAIIIGCVLGDGALVPTASGRAYRLQTEHGAKQETYLRWKHEQFQRWVLSEPTYQSKTDSWRFRTMSHPDITALAYRFYPQQKKRVPPDIADDLNDAITIAVWFMDDGCRYPQGSAVLNTHCFPIGDQRILIAALRKQYGVLATLQRNHGYWRLYIPVHYTRRLFALIEPFVLPSLSYKVGLTP
ncbi:MAG: LAGLIDADG endonuclease [Candidatus Uhrbacteria bacterium]